MVMDAVNLEHELLEEQTQLELLEEDQDHLKLLKEATYSYSTYSVDVVA